MDATLAEVLRHFGPAYLASHGLSTPQARAWRAIVSCRTPALGGQHLRCDGCGAEQWRWHSCRNRHCPQCQTRAKEAWLAARRRELLPVPYFHLVFTLPHALNGLAGCDARTLYKLLFGAVADTLNAFAANPRWLGGTPSFTLVLHTWKQDLGRHIHVHALVAGGALTADGKWVSTKRGFLFPVKALSGVYRGKFMAALDGARKAGVLRHEAVQSDVSWRTLCADLRRHDWVVYAKQPLGGPSQVLEYLGRYTHRVAISNERILGLEGNRVRFRVRESANGKMPGRRRIRRTLPAACVARRLKAYPSLRLTRPRTQGGQSCRRTHCTGDTRSRPGRGGIGGDVHAACGGHRVAELSALPRGTIPCGAGTSSALAACPTSEVTMSRSDAAFFVICLC